MTRDARTELARVSERQLVARGRRLVGKQDQLRIECGLIVAELNRRGHSFREIGPMLGIAWQSGYRWYLKAMEASDPDPE